MKTNLNVQKGFTLIELIVVIVILGILAATALPRFFDARGDAHDAAIKGVAAGLTSAASVNFAAKQLNHSVIPSSLSGAAATICSSGASGVASALQGGLPTGYTLGLSGAAHTCSADGYVDCRLTSTATSPAPTPVNFPVTCY